VNRMLGHDSFGMEHRISQHCSISLVHRPGRSELGEIVDLSFGLRLHSLIKHSPSFLYDCKCSVFVKQWAAKPWPCLCAVNNFAGVGPIQVHTRFLSPLDTDTDTSSDCECPITWNISCLYPYDLTVNALSFHKFQKENSKTYQ